MAVERVINMKKSIDKKETKIMRTLVRKDSPDLSVKPTVTNAELQKIIDDIYRGQSLNKVIGNGTLMDAIRQERKAASASIHSSAARPNCSSQGELGAGGSEQDVVQKENEYSGDELNFETVNKNLFAKFPEFLLFLDEWDLKKRECQYSMASRFADYLKTAYENGDKDTYERGLHFIEDLHMSDCHDTCELATIGYLESFLDWRNRDALLEDLGEESKKWWLELNRFWRGEVEYIGQSF